MVLSFFKSKKDSDEKGSVQMPVNSMVTPAGVSVKLTPPTSAPTPSNAPQTESWDTITRTNGSYGIEVFEENDPYTEIAEHAAILFANGQYDTARSTLESVIKGNGDPGAVKLWAMLFDLLRIRKEKRAFESLSLEFARVCELSPPAWSLDPEAEESNNNENNDNDQQAAGIAVLQGAISGDAPVFDGLLQALSKGESRGLDMRRLIGLDSEASAKLAKILQQARRRDLAWGLFAAEALAKRLAERTIAGQAQNEPQWLLMLEIFQFLGWEEQFEEKAMDYVVTFEVSPPAWEPPKTAPAIQEENQKAALVVANDDDVLTLDPVLLTNITPGLEGEILQGKLDDVKRLLVPGKECRLDFSRVQRVDFVSAGALATLLKSVKTGPISIVHANRLVAELLRVMGVDQLAHIEVIKY
jgi:ABC-type transporter Mla MlaB component